MGNYFDDDDSEMFRIELSRDEFRSLMNSPPDKLSIEINYMDEFAHDKGYLSYELICPDNKTLKIYAISMEGKWHLFGKSNAETEHIYNLIKNE